MIHVPIKNFEDYAITETGSVYSKKTQKYLSPGNNGSGYLFVFLYDKGKSKRFYIHRIVAETFIKNNLSWKDQINHIDGDKSNNHFKNLEWVSQSENMRHAVNNGLSPKGDNHHNSKLTKTKIEQILSELKTGKSQNSISKKYNISQSTVWRIKENKQRL